MTSNNVSCSYCSSCCVVSAIRAA